MNPVITKSEAMKITGGRTPLVPVQYEAAVNALAECLTLDEAKTWSDKADALAAWAKIYRNDEAGRNSRRLKIHAFRRMSDIAEQLRPKKFLGGKEGMAGGPQSALRDSGLTRSQAQAVRAVGSIPQKIIDQELRRDKVPAVSTLMKFGVPQRHTSSRSGMSAGWLALFTASKDTNAPFSRVLTFIANNAASELARDFRPDEACAAWAKIRPLLEWLDEFEQHLPKSHL